MVFTLLQEDSFNPSFLLDGLGINFIAEDGMEIIVSILVSYWMGWE